VADKGVVLVETLVVGLAGVRVRLFGRKGLDFLAVLSLVGTGELVEVRFGAKRIRDGRVNRTSLTCLSMLSPDEEEMLSLRFSDFAGVLGRWAFAGVERSGESCWIDLRRLTKSTSSGGGFGAPRL